MPSNLDGQYIRLEVISGNNLIVPSGRIPAGIYVSIDVNSRRRWKSAARVLSSDDSVAWGNTTILPYASNSISVEIRAFFELGRKLGRGELIGKLETPRNQLLNHGNEPFVLSFPPVLGVHPSLTLKSATVRACRNQDRALFHPIVEHEIARQADAGHAQFTKYMTCKSVSDLNKAVRHFKLVLSQCPVGHPDRAAAALTNLAWARLKGYIRKDLKDVNSTTSLFREALALHPQGHPDRPLSIYRLTEALNWRYDYQHTLADIRESAQLYHELLPLCPEGTYLRTIAVGENGVDYVIRECDNLPTDASDEGIQFRRVVLELCPLGHQRRPRALYNLARAVEARFDRHGSIDDIDESIRLHREAAALCPVGHSGRDHHLNNLAISLKLRFVHEGKSDDLNEAISLYEETLRPVGHEYRDLSLNNIGNALLSRFTECGEINDASRAISLHREALTLRPSGHPRRDVTLNSLAHALKTRYDNLQASEDLNEAIDLYRDSLRLKQHNHSEHHITLQGLSSVLCSRFTETQKNEDVEEAITLCQQSLAALPALHPHRCHSYEWLWEAYISRYQVQQNPADLALAVENFRLASRHPTQGFPSRIIHAYYWTAAAEKHSHVSALEAYATFFELLDGHLATRSSTISRREANAAFHYARSLPVDAASCAIYYNDSRLAVEFMELGRGQQWSLASRLRTPLEDLESANPTIARNFSQLSQRLSDAQGSAVSTNRAAADQAATEYRKFTEQWQSVVDEIRHLRGFSRFLLPPSYEDLQVAARHGPVIILIASKYSCGAIIVPTSGQPFYVPFPDLTLADLEKLKDDFAKAIRQASFMGPKQLRTDLIVLLRKIWYEVMLPIVNVLQCDLKVKSRSRIWLCPTAAFTSIPLHAAHPFRTKVDRSGLESCLEDSYICSYTPTLSALIRARQMMKTRLTPSFVAIGQAKPGAGQGEALLTVESELELVRSLVPATANPITLSGDAATRAAALEALQSNTWVHLACHGKQDRKQPYYSNFAMKDKPLTLLDIMENNVPHAEFAFLSACHTAAGDEQTPDEVIHLAAGLQFSGFKSVIGTLWVVDDAVAKHVVEAFYENMFKGLEEGDVPNYTKAAWALNKATYAVKMKVPLEQRIVFVHIGV
ncbi:CHAT domain-containing protein [Suillus lakei]|nr:CHAT domain-containing protein [Suillus lakei]